MTDKKKMLQEQQFGVMAAGIDNIFQARNPQFYLDATLMEKQADIFAMVLQAMHETEGDFVDTFKMEDPELDEMWLATGANGTFITHFTYHMQDKSDCPPFKKSIFLAGVFELNADQMIHRVAPYYYLQGLVETPDDTNGQEVFFPLETGCRNRLNGQREDCFTFADNTDEFVQMLCYGRKALEMILTGKTISVDALKYWLDEENAKEADKEYAQIVVMNPDEFSQIIAWEKAVQTFGTNPSFVGLLTPARN